MRRTAVAVMGVGCALGVVAAGGASPAGASSAGRDAVSQSEAGQGSVGWGASAAQAGPAAQAGTVASTRTVAQAKPAARSKDTTSAEGAARDAKTARGGKTARDESGVRDGAGMRDGAGVRRKPVATATPAAGTKLVEYGGYEFPVPATWPVYHLDDDPSQCVRYDINAVYLGNPGADQNCPPGIIGRAQTISITSTGASGVPRMVYQRAAVSQGGLGASFPAAIAHQRAASLPAVQGSLDQYAEQGEFRATLPHSGLSVTATYGGDPTQVERVLQGMRRIPAHLTHRAGHRPGARPDGGPAARATSRSASSGRGTPGGTPGSATSRSGTPGSGTSRSATSGAGSHGMADSVGRATPLRAGSPDPMATPATTTGKPVAPVKPTASPKPSTSPKATGSPKATSPGASPKPKPKPKPSPSQTLSAKVQATIPASPLNGFDTCTAPSVSAMRAWRSKYSAIGIYIGGQNMACDYGNLSSSWVRTVHTMGWSLLPIYVGLQAPCNSFPGSIKAKSAATQGKAAADAAMTDAGNFGLLKGSPIYFDMEAYNNQNAGCRTAVLGFLNAWTRELHAHGYFSGVYSSASSGVSDLAASNRNHSFAEPDAMWFALWDNQGNLVGTPYLPRNLWAADRDKQYAGGHNQKIGSYTLNIDSDRVGGAVSGP